MPSWSPGTKPPGGSSEGRSEMTVMVGKVQEGPVLGSQQQPDSPWGGRGRSGLYERPQAEAPPPSWPGLRARSPAGSLGGSSPRAAGGTTAPRAVPPGQTRGGAAREAVARRPRPRPAGGGPAQRPTCGKERAGRARKGQRGGGRGVRTPLPPTGCGAAGRAQPGRQLAAVLSYLHRGWALDAGSRPWGREGATAEVGPRAGDGAAPGSQGARLRGVPETVFACRQVESSPGQVWTGASRTNLLRATSGNFLKRNTDRFGFSGHFYQFGKVTKGVRTARPLQAGGTGPVSDLATGPAFSAGYSQVHCENLPGVGVCTEQTPSLQVPGCLQSAVVGEAGEICMDLDFPWNDPVLMVTVVSHPAGLVGPGSISDRKAVVASRWRTRGADLPPLGFDFLDFLWATLREPRCSQPALEGAFVLGAGRNSEISGGSSAVAQHTLALKGNSDQWRWLPHPTQQPGFCLKYLGGWPCLAWSCPAANNI